MIRSMTGFARRERQGAWGTLSCELRAVNHRYLELSLRLPEDLRGLEGDVRQLLGAALRRGKVDAGIYLRGTQAQAAVIEINRPLIEQLARSIDDVAASAGASRTRQSARPVALAGRDSRGRDATRLRCWPRQWSWCAKPRAELNESRAREGARIHEMLRSRCEALQQCVALMRARLPELSARIKARVAERVAQLGAQVDPERLEQELVLLAYKMDFEEELDRLGSHVTETMQVLDSKEPAGRRLDFLMQELNREANTLSSKSQDTETTRAAVDIKVLIEQMREQVQNVE